MDALFLHRGDSNYSVIHFPNKSQLKTPTPNESICLKQDYIVSAIGSNDSIIEIQRRVNDLSMYLEVIGLCACGVMALFYGSLSDIVGRKPVLALTLTGMTIMCAIQFAVIEFDLNNYSIYLIVAAGINGLLGGTATMLGVSFASVSDVTSRKMANTVWVQHHQHLVLVKQQITH